MLMIARLLFLQPSSWNLYISLSTKLYISLPWNFYKSITSYQFLSMMRLFFVFLMLEFVSLLTKLCNCTLLFCILRRLYKSYHSLLNSTTLFCILKICFKTNLFKSLYIRFYMSVIASNLYKSYHFLPNSTRFLFAFLIFIQIISPFYTLRLDTCTNLSKSHPGLCVRLWSREFVENSSKIETTKHFPFHLSFHRSSNRIGTFPKDF